MPPSFQAPPGVKSLPQPAIDALHQAADDQANAHAAHIRLVGSIERLNRELMPVILEVVATGEEWGVTLSQISDVIEMRSGVDYDIFPICRELYRRGLIDYRKETRPNRAGRDQVQSVQFVTEEGREVARAGEGVSTEGGLAGVEAGVEGREAWWREGEFL